MKTTVLSICLLLTSMELWAQQTWALKPNAITLPQLNTSQQNSLPPQQSGNVVYNTDQRTVAVHNGSGWQYLGGATGSASEFQNHAVYSTYPSRTIWTVPAGVTRVMAELWGGGAGGSYYTSLGSQLKANGGGAGGYVQVHLTVTPGSALTLNLGFGGRGGVRDLSINASQGEPSSLQYGNLSAQANGGYERGTGGSGETFDRSTFNFVPRMSFLADGGNGSDITWTYGQQNATTYMWILKCGNGGASYGHPQVGGIGDIFSAPAGGNVSWYTGGDSTNQGRTPGGGGGAGYYSGGAGGNGLIIVHW